MSAQPARNRLVIGEVSNWDLQFSGLWDVAKVRRGLVFVGPNDQAQRHAQHVRCCAMLGFVMRREEQDVCRMP